jgi:hypothetical protein
MRMKKKLPEANQSAVVLKSYTTTQVGAALNCHPESIRLACREGRIKAVHLGGRWRVSHAELCRIVETGIPISKANEADAQAHPSTEQPQHLPHHNGGV